MGDRPNKRRRKEALDHWKAQQRASARVALPLSNEQMQALFDMLDVELPRHGCNHSLRLVRQWCDEQELSTESVEAWLHENGGNCDCEALANSEQYWRDSIHDVNWE
jgi:hypothetical protein